MDTPETTAATPTTPAPTTKPKRSTVERVIVQGGILIMLVIVSIEAWSYVRLTLAHRGLISELERAESTDHRISKEAVTKILGGKQPDDSFNVKAAVGEERYDLYYFSGLLKQRELCVHYSVQGKTGGEPEVVEVMSVVPDEILALKSFNPKMPK